MTFSNKQTYRVPDGVLAFLVWLCALTVKIPVLVMMNISLISSMQNYIFIATFFLVFAVWLLQTREIKSNKLLFFGYALIVMTGTFANDGSIMKAIYEIMRMSVYFFLIGIATRSNSECFWKHMYYAAVILLIGNFSVWFLYPDGILYQGSPVYFFDTANETPNLVIPLLGIVLIRLFQQKSKQTIAGRIVAGFAVIGNVLMLLSIDCSTGKVAIALFVVMVLFSKMISKVLSPQGLYAVFAVLLVLLVFVGVIQWFSFIIVDILGESITLHTRTLAWDYAKEAFKLNPLFGRGYLSQEVKYSVLCEFTSGRFSHSHCELFEFLLRSGITGVVCVNLYLLSVLSHAAEAYKKSKALQIVVITIFVFLIMSINETCFTASFYLFVAVAEGFDLLQPNTITGLKQSR